MQKHQTHAGRFLVLTNIPSQSTVLNRLEFFYLTGNLSFPTIESACELRTFAFGVSGKPLNQQSPPVSTELHQFSPLEVHRFASPTISKRLNLTCIKNSFMRFINRNKSIASVMAGWRERSSVALLCLPDNKNLLLSY